MSFYSNTFRDICRPLFCYDGGLTWKTLNFIHGIWWVVARKQQIVDDTDKVSLVAQFFLQNSILGNIIGYSMAKILLTIVKTEDIFTAYNIYQEAKNDIFYTWRGAYKQKDEPGYKIWLLTAYKILILMKASFFFVMTWVDCGVAINFGSRAQFEGSLRLKNNLQRVARLIYRNPELVRKSLYQHKGLIKMLYQKDDTHTLQTIRTLVANLEDIQNNIIVKGCKTLYELGRSVADSIGKASSNPAPSEDPTRFSTV